MIPFIGYHKKLGNTGWEPCPSLHCRLQMESSLRQISSRVKKFSHYWQTPSLETPSTSSKADSNELRKYCIYKLQKEKNYKKHKNMLFKMTYCSEKKI